MKKSVVSEVQEIVDIIKGLAWDLTAPEEKVVKIKALLDSTGETNLANYTGEEIGVIGRQKTDKSKENQ